MKVKVLFISIITVLLLFVLSSCSNTPVSDNLKELAKVEVKIIREKIYHLSPILEKIQLPDLNM